MLHNPNTLKHPKMIWMLPLALSFFGILTIASITSRGGLDGQIGLYSTGGKQLFALVVGFILMLVCTVIPLSFWKKYSFVFWALAVALAFATLIPGIGVRAGGARRWISFGPLMLQPLELLSLFVPIHLAKCLSASEKNGLDVFVFITLVIMGISVFPLLLQPNLGGSILVVLLCMSIHIENRGWLYPFMCGSILSVVVLPFILFVEYRMRRVIAFLDPWSDPLNSGFQAIQGRIAFANGRIFGAGIGKGLQKLNYLPAAHTDYIFSVIGEEFGLFGTLSILGTFCVWFLTTWGLHRRQTDPFLSALTWGIAVSVALPLFINLGGVMGLMPLTGIPLPFISYGGSALMVMWIKVGILVRIAREMGGES